MAMAAMADPYVHLMWGKMILYNRLFTDGLYPLGYNSLIASLGRLSQIDLYDVVRFIGPIGSSILVVGYFWFIKEVTKKEVLAVIGMVAFGLSTFNGLPVEFFRQTLSLSMEFSISLIFPGIIFLHNYLVKGDRNDLLLFGITVVDVVIIHSYGALFFVLATASLMLSSMINRVLTFKKFIPIVVVGISGGIIGMLPIIIGKLQGVKWHTVSTSWISSNIRIQSPQHIIVEFAKDIVTLPPHIIIIGGLVLCSLLGSSIVSALTSRGRENLWDATVFILMLIVMLLYFGPDNGFSLLDYSRVKMYLTMCLLAGFLLFIANSLNFIERILQKIGSFSWRNLTFATLMKTCLITSFTVSWLLVYPFQLTADNEMALRPIEYNSAVSIYYRVKKDYPRYDWTLVAPVEQYQEAFGYGYHYELWKFNEDFTMEDALNPAFDIPIPTTYIFIYVEKVPLRIWTNNELATTPEGHKGKTEIHYRDAAGRAKLEKSMWEWCEAYLKTHDNMTVFYEDEVLKVYKVVHDPARWMK